jgi:hypothetical protein
MGVGQQRQCIGPGERRTLARGDERRTLARGGQRRLAPDGDNIETLLRLQARRAPCRLRCGFMLEVIDLPPVCAIR